MLLAAPAPARAEAAGDGGGIAPEPSRHALGLDVGLVVRSVRDDLLVPLASTGPGLHIGGRYEGLVGPGVLTASLAVETSFIFDRYGGAGMTVLHDIRVGYLPMFARSGSWTWAVGPSVGYEGDTNFFNSWDDAHVYWVGSRWLGPAVRGWGELGERWRLDVAGELGLIGLVGRPDVYRENKQDAMTHVGYLLTAPYGGSQFAWVGDWQQLRLSADLRSRAKGLSAIAGGWSFGADLTFLHAANPESSVALQLLLRSSWTWGL